MPHLTLLGGAVLEDESGPIGGPAARRHPIALLALLATAPSRTRSRSKVAGLLWPDADEATARSRLNTCLYRVRSGLGADAVASVGDDLRLDPEAVDSDVIRFERALEADETERAVEIYGGPFLDGFRLGGSAAFEKWTDRERDRLARDHRDALERLAERAEEEGDPATAAGWWRERAREDPYDSRVVGRLMKALTAAGNRAEALRVGRVHEQALREDIGTEASAGLRDLVERIRAGNGPPGSPPPRGSDGADDRPPGGEDLGQRPGRQDGSAEGPVPPGGELTGESDGPDGGPNGRRRALLAVLILLVVAVAGIRFWPGVEGGSPSGSSHPVVAVLPFDAVGETDAGVFAEGMHGDLLTLLAHVSGLDVIAATSVERYRGSGLPLPVIADSLGADWIVEGGVQQAGGGIRVNAQLVDPESGTPAWAESYRRDLTAGDLFDLQADLARNIVRSLEARLTLEEAERVERRPTGDLQAYQSYLRGRIRLEERTEEAIRVAAEQFERAIRRDSSFALAWSGLAEAAILLDEYGYGSLPGPPVVEPERAARQALSLDSTLAEAHVSLGYVHLLRAEGPAAVRRLRRAVDLQPNSPGARFRLGEALAMVGRLDASIRHVERAVELDPLAPFPRVPLGGFYHLAGRHEEALREIRKAQDLAPDLALSHLLEGQALSAVGRQEEALQAFERGRGLAAPGSVFARILRAWPAVAHVRAGDTARARTLMSSYEASPAGAFDRAVVHAALGEEDAALDALRRARLTDHYFRIFMFRYAPVLEPLRDDAGYRKLLRRVNRKVGLLPDGSFPPGESVSSAG